MEVGLVVNLVMKWMSLIYLALNLLLVQEKEKSQMCSAFGCFEAAQSRHNATSVEQGASKPLNPALFRPTSCGRY